MHGAGIICQKQTAFAQFIDQLIEGGLADSINAVVAESL